MAAESPIVKLQKLQKLHDGGILDESEFRSRVASLVDETEWADYSGQVEDLLLQLVPYLENGTLANEELVKIKTELIGGAASPRVDPGASSAAPVKEPTVAVVAQTPPETSPRESREPLEPDVPEDVSEPDNWSFGFDESPCESNNSTGEEENDVGSVLPGRPSRQFDLPLAVISGVIIITVIGWIYLVATEDAREWLAMIEGQPSDPVLRMVANASGDDVELIRDAFEDNEEATQRWSSFASSRLAALHSDEGADETCDRVETLQQVSLQIEGAERLNSACEALDSASDKLREARSENSDRLRKVEDAREDVEEAEQTLEKRRRLVNELQNSATWARGYNHGSLGGNRYEVSIGSFYDRAVLHTTETTFTSEGSFEMYLNRDGTESVPMKDGSVRTFPRLRENASVELELSVARAALMQARSELKEAKTDLRNLPYPDLIDPAPLEADIRAAEAELQAAMESAQKSSDVDGQAVKSNEDEPASEPEIASRVDAICEGNGSAVACSKCPGYTSAAGGEGEVRLHVAASGAITGRGEVEELVDLSGCEAHAYEFGGSVLIRKGDSGWKRVEYFKGFRTKNCIVLEDSGGLPVLVCDESHTGQGYTDGAVSAYRFKGGEINGEAIFPYEDSSGGCPRDELIIGDVKGLAKRGNSVGITFEGGRTRIPAGYDSFCDVPTSFKPNKKVYEFTIPFDGTDFDTSAAPSIGKMAAELDQLMKVDAGSEMAYKLHKRRLDALRSLQSIDEYEAMNQALVTRFPEKKRSLMRELTKVFEESGQFEKAGETHAKLVRDFPGDEAIAAEAAWFFASAPEGTRDDATAIMLAGRAGEQNPWSILARAELVLRNEGKGQAATYIAAKSPKKTPGFYERRAEKLRNGSAEPRSYPTDLVSPLPHKVPKHWGGTVPSVVFTDQERLFSAVYAARDYIARKDHRSAIALYEEAIGRARDQSFKTELRLWLGKAYEKADRHREAKALYESLLSGAAPGDTRAAERMAWFLATSDDRSLRDLDRAHGLASSVVESTNRTDPSILDTLAEIELQKGNVKVARSLIQESITLDPRREYYRYRLEDFEDGRSNYMN